MTEKNPYENRDKFKWCGKAAVIAWNGFVEVEIWSGYKIETCLYWKNGCDDCKDVDSKCDQSVCSCNKFLPDLHS